MCNSGRCHYERFDGTCKGRPWGRSLLFRPACMEEEDFEAFKASAEEDAILEYELSKGDPEI